jgi:hypothetical protein
MGSTALNRTTGHWHRATLFERSPPPFALSVAASAAKSKSTWVAGLAAFDFAALRSGRTETVSTVSEEVYESLVV